MKLWVTLSFALFLSESHARVIDVADEEIAGAPSPSRFEGPGGIRHTKTQTLPSPGSEGTVRSISDDDDTALSTLLGGDASTTPGANTPGGGVPRIGEGFLTSPQPVELPWWKRWWQSIMGLFS
ncbi:MAG: hypothetical protein HYX35_01260 [Proteobacteria bacterium]|nr:hypothetical protein [Pseudomonadota bacterium]